MTDVVEVVTGGYKYKGHKYKHFNFLLKVLKGRKYRLVDKETHNEVSRRCLGVRMPSTLQSDA